jgi:hypothetical protein
MVRENYLGFGSRGTELAENTYTLDFLAFSLTIFLAKKSRFPGLRGPTIFETIAQDATWYFLIIFTAHLVFEMTLNLGRVSASVFFPGLQEM